MKFGFVAKHRGAWPVNLMCEALGVSRSGFYAWLMRPRSRRSLEDEVLGGQVRNSFIASEQTYGARRVWHDVLELGQRCGLHRIERLMHAQALRARPRRRGLPKDVGERGGDRRAVHGQQPVGRARAGRLFSPAAQRAEFYGLWTFAIRLSAMVGPLTYGLITLLSAGNHRLAIVSTGVFFVLGLLLLMLIDVPRGVAAAETAGSESIAAGSPTS